MGAVVADPSRFAGNYTESIRWWDDSGRAGELQGSLTVAIERARISLRMDDGHVILGELSIDPSEPTRLVGSGGDATSSGVMYFGEDVLILEYEADVRGRMERTVDVWTLDGSGVILRAGLIHQEGLTIWFQGRMQEE